MGLEEVISGFEKSKTEADKARAQGIRETLQHLSKGFEQGASIDTPWFYLVVQKPL